jgi:type IV secretion system protein VirB4
MNAFEEMIQIFLWPFSVGVNSLKNMISGKSFSGNSYGFSDLLMYAKPLDNGIILQTDGSFLAGCWVRGPDVETSTDEELNVISTQLNDAFKSINSGWLFHVDTIRYDATSYTPESDSFFTNSVTRLIDEERRELYEAEDGHYENAYAITFTYRPNVDFGSKFGFFFRRKDNNTQFDLSFHLKQFKERFLEITDYLSHNLAMKKMDTQELISYISWCITGDAVEIKLPIKAGMYLKTYLASKDLIGGESPKIGDKHIRAITIFGFPSESYPGIVDRLNSLDFEYRWNSRFILIDRHEGQKIIDRISNLWYQKRISPADTVKMSLSIDTNIKVNQNADNQYQDAESAKALNDSGEVKYGYYTSVVIIANEDSDIVERNAQNIRSELQHLGFESQIERHHAVEAFLGSLPGYSYANIRKWLIHSQNVADLVPSTSIWSGLVNNPCPYYTYNNPPLFFARTTGYTPLRVSLHNGESGHTLIVGPSAIDKAVLMNFIIAQHFRYKNARVYVFDKNKMTLPLCYGCKGDFYDIGGENNDTYFQPLSQLENDLDFDFAVTWIEELCILNKMSTSFNDAHRDAIIKALRLMQKERFGKDRTLSSFRLLVQDIDKVVSELLENFCSETLSVGDPVKTQGFRNKIFDSESDFLSIAGSKFTCFEMSKLMEIGDGVAIPALRYIIHAIGKQLYSSDPTLIIFNESAILFKNPVIREKLLEWAKSVITYNVAIIFTLDMNDIAKYDDLNKELKTLCDTKFFTMNNKAMTDDIYPLYKQMALNDKQIETISTAYHGQYLYMCDAGNRVFSLDISKNSATAAFTSSFEITHINKAVEIYNKSGKNHFAKEWLNYQNVSPNILDKLKQYS